MSEHHTHKAKLCGHLHTTREVLSIIRDIMFIIFLVVFLITIIVVARFAGQLMMS